MDIHENWVSKHRPLTIDKFIGGFSEDIIKDKHVILIHGEAATGKTTLANIIGNMISGGILIMQEYSFLSPVGVLYDFTEVVLLDDFSLCTEHKQREIASLIQERCNGTFYIIVTAFKEHLTKEILDTVQVSIETKLTVDDSVKILANIAEEESLRYNDESLKYIVEHAKSTRDAIFKMQYIAENNKGELTLANVQGGLNG